MTPLKNSEIWFDLRYRPQIWIFMLSEFKLINFYSLNNYLGGKEVNKLA